MVFLFLARSDHATGRSISEAPPGSSCDKGITLVLTQSFKPVFADWETAVGHKQGCHFHKKNKAKQSSAVIVGGLQEADAAGNGRTFRRVVIMNRRE